jgi:pimeloyl-ACP methyl ester carboxylesterase
MATTAVSTKTGRRRTLRILRWILIVLFPLILALLAFALLRPLDLLWTVTRTTLLLNGIHSEYTEISFGNAGMVRVHYYEGGADGARGVPLVLVHGLGGRADDWTSLMPQLVRDHHHVYALDLPGYGRSDWPRNAQYSIPELSGAVEAFMNDCHITRADLGGWSMGGWIAMRVSLDEPQRIRRLLIFDSAGLKWDLAWDPSRFVPDTPQKLDDLDRLLLPGPPAHTPGFVARDIFRFEAQHGWVLRRNLDSMVTGKDLLDGKVGALKMPMLILWGKQDHLIPLSEGEAIHRAVPQSEMEVFDGCGHLMPEFCATRMVPVVKGFLDETSPLGGREAEIPR